MADVDKNKSSDQDGLNEEDVEALLGSFGASETPPAAGKDASAPREDDKIIRQEDVDKLLSRGIDAGKQALGLDKELIAAAQEDVFAGAARKKEEPMDIDFLVDVPLKVKIELGRNKMTLEDVLRLKEGAIVELEKLAGDPLDILVNERLVARGEVLVLNDNFCIRITEIVNPDERQKPR